jgi:hypothetical protein
VAMYFTQIVAFDLYKESSGTGSSSPFYR